MIQLPTPAIGRAAAEAFVETHLSHLICDAPVGSRSFFGGQAAADNALRSFDVTGYASMRNDVHPEHRRGASRLSPYIRHGLLPLTRVWDHVDGGASRDVAKFRDELLWQEFARHWYAQLGKDTRQEIRNQLPIANQTTGWNHEMACTDLVVSELESDGWLVNQTRMWLASHWTVRKTRDWRVGEDFFFQHLLDGSRAANRLGWQWTSGAGSNKPYSFSRWQVNKRAPGVCEGCSLRAACPIEDWPSPDPLQPIDPPLTLRTGLDVARTSGPTEIEVSGIATHVWLTAESLGIDDPALAAKPNLPAIFIFDEPLLRSLQLSGKRLVFLVETLAEIAVDRDLEIALGEPATVLAHHDVAVTFAPVPGFASRSRVVRPVELHPWPWLVSPKGGSIASFSAWRRSTPAPGRRPNA